MAMTEKARAAYEELKALGAYLIESDQEHIAFFLHEQNLDQTEFFHDMTGRHIREEFVNGEYRNPVGVRQDVHEIFRKYELVTDHEDETHLAVYNDPYSAGWSHDNYFSVHHLGQWARGFFEGPYEYELPVSANDLREMLLERMASVQHMNPNYTKYWEPLSAAEKEARLVAAIPEGDYPDIFEEQDAPYWKYRKWTYRNHISEEK